MTLLRLSKLLAVTVLGWSASTPKAVVEAKGSKNPTSTTPIITKDNEYVVPEVEITLNLNRSRLEEEDPPVAWDLWV